MGKRGRVHWRTVIGAAALAAGLAVATAFATAPPPAPPVATGPVSQLSPTTAQLTGEINPQGQTISYQFAYGTTTAYGQTTPPATVAPGTNPNAPVSVHAKITGLTAGVTYHYALVDLTRGGNGGDQTFTAPAASLTKPTATTLPASGITQTGATLAGTVNPQGQATTYKFDYGPTTAYGSRTPVQQAGAGTAEVPASAIVANLQPGIAYHYRLVASSLAGTVLGGDQTFTTLAPGQVAQPLPPAATTGAASAVSATGATLAGQVDPNGAATTYSFEYGPTTAYGAATTPVSAGAGITPTPASAALAGLTPATTYHYRLDATSSAGTTPGADLTFTTLAGAAPAPKTTPAGPGTPPGPGGTTPGVGVPTLSGLRALPARFFDRKPSCARGARCKAVKLGTSIRFTLSEPATVKLGFVRAVKVCKGAGAARTCTTRKRALGAIAVAGHAGPNAVRFSGRLHGRPLPLGKLLMNVRPVAGKSVGAVSHLTLTVE